MDDRNKNIDNNDINKTINKQRFGLLIKTHRKAKGLSQEQFAEILGLTRKSISCIERGECYPSQDNIFRMALILDFSLDEFLFGYNRFSESISIEEINKKLNLLTSEQRKTIIYTIQAMCDAMLSEK